MAFNLVCTVCGARYGNSQYRVTCEVCDGLLDVEYDASPAEGAWGEPGASGLARYARMLPIKSVANLVTLGEGDTPLLRLERLGGMLGVDLYVKLEYLNPTGSFKDRGNAVQVTVLRETGVDTVVDSTTGNAGHSTAAYCARAGIRYIGFSEKGARDTKLQAAAYHGTELHPTGGSKDDRREAALQFSQDTGVVFMDYGRNAYFIEGEKTLSYEIAEQMDTLPEHVVASSGNGSILLGMWRGFQDLRASGRVDRVPRFHAAQSEGFQPMVAAYHGRDWAPQPGATSVAIGVTIAAPPRLDTVVRICRESGGLAIAVPEEEILAWQERLASQEGILVEATSALGIGAVKALVAQGAIAEGARVLVPLTGFGMKEPLPNRLED